MGKKFNSIDRYFVTNFKSSDQMCVKSLGQYLKLGHFVMSHGPYPCQKMCLVGSLSANSLHLFNSKTNRQTNTKYTQIPFYRI